jgi:hypothetical protein
MKNLIVSTTKTGPHKMMKGHAPHGIYCIIVLLEASFTYMYAKEFFRATHHAYSSGT